MARISCKSYAARVAAALAYLALSAALYLATPWIRPANSVLVFLAAMCAAVGWTFPRMLGRAELAGYRRGGMPAGVCAVALYASFASFGYRLFLSGERMVCSVGRLLALGMGAIWFVPVLAVLLSLLEGTCRAMARRAEPDRNALQRDFWLIWGVALACQAVVIASFWPGGFPRDSVTQLYQAKGLSPLNDWHPVMHTLLHRFFLMFWDHPGFLVIVQGVAFTLVVARAALTACRFGARLRTVLIGTAVFCLLPNQALSNIGLLKDFPFTYAMVWGILLLGELAMDLTRLRRPGYAIQLVACMFLIGTLRHNGILPMLFMAAALVGVTARHWRTVQARGLVCALCAVLLFAGYKGPLMKALNVEKNTLSPYTTMFCAVGAVLHNEESLSPQSMQKLETEMPLTEWKDLYSRFEGRDPYALYGANRFCLDGFSFREAFKIYLEALWSFPDAVIKDRLDGTNLLWDVTQPDESFNTDFSDHSLPASEVGLDYCEEGEKYQNPSLPARAYRFTTRFAFPGEQAHDQLSNMLLWRSGAYVILLFTLVLFWRKNRLHGPWLASLPLWGNLAAMLLALCHQSFRYVYFVQACVACLLILTILFAVRGRRARE